MSVAEFPMRRRAVARLSDAELFQLARTATAPDWARSTARTLLSVSVNSTSFSVIEQQEEDGLAKMEAAMAGDIIEEIDREFEK